MIEIEKPKIETVYRSAKIPSLVSLSSNRLNVAMEILWEFLTSYPSVLITWSCCYFYSN